MSDFNRLEKLMNEFAANTVPGCGCCIMQNDEILFEKYAGYANLEQKSPVTQDTLYRQASTTKLFTYAIMGMLYEEGAFLFSDPIAEYLPEWKNTVKWVQNQNGGLDYVPLSRPITIADAATMRCGLPYCMSPVSDAVNPTVRAMSDNLQELWKKGKPTLRDEVRVMAEAPVMFEPGTKWLYGFGSEIIGAVLEEITGKCVRELFEERVIVPLGLKHTHTYHNTEIRQQMTEIYSKDEEKGFVNISAGFDESTDPSVLPKGARTSLLTTPRDFAVFMQMLANGGSYRGTRLLSPGTVEMLHTNCLTPEQQREFSNGYLAGYGYGYGFRTLVDKGAGGHNGSLGAFGWTGGFGTWAEADPVNKLALVYMHNMVPNEEFYHHIRFRNTTYACAEV